MGINEFVNAALPAWTGVLKTRYTDFLVNEVDPLGHVVHLASLAPPLPASDRPRAKDERFNVAKATVDTPAAAAAAVAATIPAAGAEAKASAAEQLSAFVPADVATAIAALSATPPGTAETITTPAIADKEDRGAFHGLVRTLFASALVTETLAGVAGAAIVVKRSCPAAAATDRRRSRRGGKNHRNPKQAGWQLLGGEYCHFTLYKENRDTMEVVSLLGRLLRLPSPNSQHRGHGHGPGGSGSKAISFAGTKDRRAVTVQRCAAYRITAERLAALNAGGVGGGGLHGARLGDFAYRPQGLTLGDLAGNEFAITLRRAASAQPGVSLGDAASAAVAAVTRSGFANYFGLQRFGSHAVSTAAVGARLLRADWCGAVHLILSYSAELLSPAGEASEAGGANEAGETREANEAGGSNEAGEAGEAGEADEADEAPLVDPAGPAGVGGDTRKVAQDDRARAEACHAFLAGHDPTKAHSLMPRKCVAESAILRYLAERHNAATATDWLGAINAIPRPLRSMYAHAYQSLVWNHVASARLRLSPSAVLPGDLVLVIQQTEKEAGAIEAEAEEEEAEVDADGEMVVLAAPAAADAGSDSGFQRARPLTASEASSGRYTLNDVVLPTPGWDIVYPAIPQLQDVYAAVMANDSLDPRRMKRSVREWSLPGSYRPLIGRFVDGQCACEVLRCRVGEQVVWTDLDAILAGGRHRRAAEEGGGAGEEAGEHEDVVVLRMRLGTSSYATMALRELMRGGLLAYRPEFGR